MKKRVLSLLFAVSLVTIGCGAAESSIENGTGTSSVTEKVNESASNAELVEQSESTFVQQNESNKSTLSGTGEVIYYDPELVPSIPSYKVSDDFSNVTYHKYFAYLFEAEYDNEYNDTSLMRNALCC